MVQPNGRTHATEAHQINYLHHDRSLPLADFCLTELTHISATNKGEDFFRP